MGCLMGIPRYLPRDRVDWKPRMYERDSLVSLYIFGEKYTLDLALLTDYPDFSQNSSRTSLMVE